MKLGKDVLLEIMAILQDGIVKGTDVSQSLRELDLASDANKEDELQLSTSYLKSKGR